MTKTIKLITVLFASLLIFGTSCNKYEDGPKLSLRTKKARMANTWKVIEAIDADTDITESAAGATWTLDKEGNYKTGGTITSTGATAPEKNGSWEFNDDKTKLILTTENVKLPKKWVITRLKNDELWVKRIEANGKIDSFKLEGQD